MSTVITVTQRKTAIEETGLLLFAAVVGVFFSWMYARHIAFSVAPTVDPAATAAEPTVLTQTNSWVSSDGKYNLVLSSTPAANHQKQFTVVTKNVDGTNAQTIFTALLPEGSELAIPYNAWSPDDKFLFLEKNDGVDVDYLVMRADGKAITGDKQFMSVKDYFSSRNTGRTIHAVTGWASSTLLIITTYMGTEQSTSYWLEIPTGALIPLATRF